MSEIRYDYQPPVLIVDLDPAKAPEHRRDSKYAL